ncbi:MAG: hypothetical protein QME66_05895 [Candidatus Eisenbacteria bacterium]|nr:hypothetical protein [Candidatus Eisenbacteria bacterium]
MKKIISVYAWSANGPGWKNHGIDYSVMEDGVVKNKTIYSKRFKLRETILAHKISTTVNPWLIAEVKRTEK